jgi:hypothetical protein
MELKSWNRKEIDSKFAGAEDLSQLVRAIEVMHEEENKFVSSIRVNGLRLTEEDEEKLSHCKTTEVDTIEVTLSTETELNKNLLSEVKQHITKTHSLAVETADYFLEAKQYEGLMSFKSLTRFIDTLNPLIALLKDSAIEQNFIALVKKMLSALDQKDYVLLSDLLEYDLVESLQEIGRRFEETDKEQASSKF